MECNKANDGKGGDSGEGVEDKVDEKKDSADSAKTASQSLIPLDDANAFSTEDFCKAFNESPEAQALRMVFRGCNVLFLKQGGDAVELFGLGRLPILGQHEVCGCERAGKQT